MRVLVALVLAALALVIIQGCGDVGSDEEELREAVVVALDAFAAEFVSSRPSGVEGYVERLEEYLEEHPSFFGSASALLDQWGIVFASPYVYRTGDGYASTDLATPSYNIEEEEWLIAPLETDAGVWTEPYFDEGGGNIWMVTRSVPVRNADGVFAIVTTDLGVDPPDN